MLPIITIAAAFLGSAALDESDTEMVGRFEAVRPIDRPTKADIKVLFAE